MKYLGTYIEKINIFDAIILFDDVNKNTNFCAVNDWAANMIDAKTITKLLTVYYDANIYVNTLIYIFLIHYICIVSPTNLK